MGCLSTMWGTGGHLWVLRANRGFETVESQFGRGRGARVLAGRGESARTDHGASHCVLYLERADVCGALDAARVGAGDGGAASFLICHEPGVRHASGSHGDLEHSANICAPAEGSCAIEV